MKLKIYIYISQAGTHFWHDALSLPVTAKSPCTQQRLKPLRMLIVSFLEKKNIGRGHRCFPILAELVQSKQSCFPMLAARVLTVYRHERRAASHFELSATERMINS